MLYKIEFYYNGKKDKRKLYETEKAYEYWWKYHQGYVDYFRNMGLDHGIVGYIDGVVNKTYGDVTPQKVSVIM